MRATLSLFAVLCAALGPMLCSGDPQVVLGDDPGKPTEITKELICESCHAVVIETHGRLSMKNPSVADVVEAMEGVCHPMALRVYKFIPPKMLDGCNAFLQKYEDELEIAVHDAITHTAKNGGHPDDVVCVDFCKGVKFERPKGKQSSTKNEAQKGKAKGKGKGKAKGKGKGKGKGKKEL